MNFKKHGIAAIAIAAAAALSACSAGSLGSSDDGDGASEGASKVELTYLVDNAENTVTVANAMAVAFNSSQDEVEVTVETRPQGTDGDNVVKTRLATDEMTDIFAYNSGSLLQALDPARNLVDLSGEDFVGVIDESFQAAVSSDGKIYGVPVGSASAGGIFYNRAVFDEVGIQPPKTWDEFMANNEKLKAAGYDPVIQSYGETWTSQLFVLADFHNVLTADPEWADKYTANQAKYATEPALTGFERLEELYTAGYWNEDFATLKLDGALAALVEGTGAQYPSISFIISNYSAIDEDAAENIGLFGQPGDDAESHGITAWVTGGIYVPATTEGEKLEAAKKFLAWVATPEACDVQSEAIVPTGPYMIDGCSLPEGLPTAVNDMQTYFESGATSPALEFLSPVKGPNLEKITVEVGSGIRSAADGAKLYDQDVEKQAQQLGLEGW